MRRRHLPSRQISRSATMEKLRTAAQWRLQAVWCHLAGADYQIANVLSQPRPAPAAGFACAGRKLGITSYCRWILFLDSEAKCLTGARDCVLYFVPRWI